MGSPRQQPKPYRIDTNCHGMVGIPAGHLFKAAFMPIGLKLVLEQHDIAASDMAACIVNKRGKPISRPSVYQCANRGVIPLPSTPDFKEQVEKYLRGVGVSDAEISTIWTPLDDGTVVHFRKKPGNHAERIRQGMGLSNKNNSALTETTKEAEMLTPTTLRHFKFFKNPFLDDIRGAEDVFMSESHRYAEAAMLDAARNGGFVAVVGECGAGKSVLRRKMVSAVNESGDVRVIFPQTIDKGVLTSGLILDAIVGDMAPGTSLKRSNEARARQVKDLLISSSRAGMRHVLIIEEAHDLSVPCMKQLKRLWEIEDGFRKVLGIVLIGQQELQARLNRQTHPEMREVILRCLISELLPLNGDLEQYVAHKFERTGANASEIFADGWADAVRQKLTAPNGYSALFPLDVNNLLAMALNLAAQVGEPRVTAETILGV